MGAQEPVANAGHTSQKNEYNFAIIFAVDIIFWTFLLRAETAEYQVLEKEGKGINNNSNNFPTIFSTIAHYLTLVKINK